MRRASIAFSRRSPVRDTPTFLAHKRFPSNSLGTMYAFCDHTVVFDGVTAVVKPCHSYGDFETL